MNSHPYLINPTPADVERHRLQEEAHRRFMRFAGPVLWAFSALVALVPFAGAAAVGVAWHLGRIAPDEAGIALAASALTGLITLVTSGGGGILWRARRVWRGMALIARWSLGAAWRTSRFLWIDPLVGFVIAGGVYMGALFVAAVSAGGAGLAVAWVGRPENRMLNFLMVAVPIGAMMYEVTVAKGLDLVRYLLDGGGFKRLRGRLMQRLGRGRR